MTTTSVRNRLAGSLPASAFCALAFFLLTGLLASPLRADDSGQPARAIRLSSVDGKVQLAQGAQVIADQAVINTPLVEGETLTTGDDGKAEIQFEDGSVARLSPNTSLTLKTLSGSGSSAEAEMSLEHGLAYFELQGTGQVGSMRVHFDDSEVTGSGFTVFRVSDDTPPGAIAVFSGNAHIDRGSGPAIDLHGGESVTFTAVAPSGYQLAESVEPDSWDAWNSDRDQALTAEAAAQTNAPADLAPSQTGNPAWNDLDSSGSWYNVPDQGYVWSPYDASNPGFDPYGNGSWVNTPGFGYTWASGYPWGYIPYSCGAWNYYDSFGWGWAPGFGGCNPWWGVGFYGGPIIGRHPGWYRPVRRPDPPRRPGPGHPIPMIAVNRRARVLVSGLPPRDRNTSVNIGGHTVGALHPIPARNSYDRAPVANRFATSPASSTGRPTYTAPRPTYNVPAQGFRGSERSEPARVYTPPEPPRNFSAPSAPTPPEPPRSYSPPEPSRTYTPPPSAPSRPSGSSGGGYHSREGSSGGGSHSSGGGGGHSSGGGGGGGHSGGGGHR